MGLKILTGAEDGRDCPGLLQNFVTGAVSEGSWQKYWGLADKRDDCFAGCVAGKAIVFQ